MRGLRRAIRSRRPLGRLLPTGRGTGDGPLALCGPLCEVNTHLYVCALVSFPPPRPFCRLQPLPSCKGSAAAAAAWGGSGLLRHRGAMQGGRVWVVRGWEWVLVGGEGAAV